ncbi:MAG: glucose-6-phosphate isomerase [Proteobacteria bacterium]|nr:glucose-6-phosphate isomerase [Pseudomonadota bacterium]
MPYRQTIDACFADRIGDSGLRGAEFEAVLAASGGALEGLRAAHRDGSLPLLRLAERSDDLAALDAVAERFAGRFESVVVLGTGGSSLGGRALYALADLGFGPPAGRPRVVFAENVDPHTFAALLARLDPAATGYIAISKSGGTPETLVQYLAAFAAVAARLGPGEAAARFLAVTEPKDTPLRRHAAARGIPVLDHDPGVGGRYSVLSLVGLLPAMIAGLDARRLREGAAAALAPVLEGRRPADCPPALGAAVNVALLKHRGITISVLMPYLDRLATLGLWYRQLWAESLGKDGTGTTPVAALGTVDQHSQLQLFLAGPRDKLFTLITAPQAGLGPRIAPEPIADERLAYLGGHTMGDLLDAEARATAATLIRNRCPTRLVSIERLDERTMGALLMHFMLETVIAGRLLGVDPFDQPAVEEGKVLARQYLAEMARGRGG